MDPEITEYAIGALTGLTDDNEVAFGLQMSDGSIPGCLMPPSAARALALLLLSCAAKSEGMVSRKSEPHSCLEVGAEDGVLMVRMFSPGGEVLTCPMGPHEVRVLMSALLDAAKRLSREGKGVAHG
jgi:hypothetical protein